MSIKKPSFLSLLLFFIVASGCQPHSSSPGSKKKPALTGVECAKTGTPKVTALYTAEGVLLWELGMTFPRKNVFFDAIEVHGNNLCAGNLSLGDGYTLAKPLLYSLITNGNIRIEVPWALERITQSILFRTSHSFTRVDLHVVPVDKLTRQIFIRGLKSETFAEMESPKSNPAE